MVEVVVPADIEADLVAHYGGWGIDLSTQVGLKRFPGMIRVSRTGGGLTNQAQDAPVVLFEVWETDSVSAWEKAVRVWAILRLAEHKQSIAGHMLYGADIDVPRTLDDDLAPELHRTQFAATLTVPLTELVLEEL